MLEMRWTLGLELADASREPPQSRPVVPDLLSLVAADALLIGLAAWLSHVGWTIAGLITEPSGWCLLLGAAGVVLPPLGVVHGLSLWL